MVDFGTMRSEKRNKISIVPQDIFRRLPKPSGINDLYESQGKVLTDWFQNREKKDTVVKLHTGGGKTLVGLLMAQSSILEKNEGALYLCPTRQLVTQTLEKAHSLGINAVPYIPGQPLHEDFINGNAVMVCSYKALFNGRSKFKIRGSSTHPIKCSIIILDDAHVAFNEVRDNFTLNIPKESTELYKSTTSIFRQSLKEIGSVGTFDDTVNGSSDSILEVPYWAWFQNIDTIRAQISPIAEEKYPFVWPSIRDNLEFCHALISRKEFSISPYFPLVDIFPTFSNCPRRVYMSATIADDSEIIRTFDASEEDVSKPLTSASLAGISERMILVPSLMSLKENVQSSVLSLLHWTSEDKKLGSIILTPSGNTAQKWEDDFILADGSKEVERLVHALQSQSSFGPVIFANRYDGIDLPGDSCRLLIMDSLPAGTSTYELYRATALYGGASINRMLAQRIEQGIGRGARGSGDHCVVILMGSDLVAWIGKRANFELLTSPTRIQLQLGLNISEKIVAKDELLDTVNKSFERDPDWIRYQAETLAEEIQENPIQTDVLKIAAAERKAFNLWRDGYHEKGIARLEKILEMKIVDQPTYGWFKQLAAKIACHWNQEEQYKLFQQDAFSKNRNLIRPLAKQPYKYLPSPSAQAEAIVAPLKDYALRRSYIQNFEEVVSFLVPSASSNQFEEAFKNLGLTLRSSC